ncbi:class I SAM-dependent methyltransferase [Rhodospirillaceae bacterium SYSU D60014]|uniref:class I SAM-dependent methyltransferase n=1 Tax=Virgifigura deserti TaxID=2268457 RepID=UPI0013C4B7B3
MIERRRRLRTDVVSVKIRNHRTEQHMQRDDYTAANRQAWDEAAPIHRERKFAELIAQFSEPGHSCLDPIETAILRRIGIDGKDVAQLCCNNGRELLSVKNLGAGRCVGFDISEGFIEQARELAAAGGIDCSFVATDIYAIPHDYDESFDLVTITIGALGWMPDLTEFLAVAAHLLKPGGWLFIYEQHPILDMFEPGDTADPLALRYSYFQTEPFRNEYGLDYWGKARYPSKPMYWFHHKLSDVIAGCLANGLALEAFEEYPHDISVFTPIAESPIRPPMSYSLVAWKEG